MIFLNLNANTFSNEFSDEIDSMSLPVLIFRVHYQRMLILYTLAILTALKLTAVKLSNELMNLETIPIYGKIGKVLIPEIFPSFCLPSVKKYEILFQVLSFMN